MGSLIHFLIWGSAFFFIMRFGCGAHVMGHSHRHNNEGWLVRTEILPG
jgi:hypothetical protein